MINDRWVSQNSLLCWTRHSYELQKLQEKWLWTQFRFANPLALLLCFKLHKKWVLKVNIEDPLTVSSIGLCFIPNLNKCEGLLAALEYKIAVWSLQGCDSWREVHRQPWFVETLQLLLSASLDGCHISMGALNRWHQVKHNSGSTADEPWV